MVKSFDVVREYEQQRGDEWKYGAVATDLAAIPVADRIRYLPQGVLQYNNVFDTNGCASRGPLNILETKLDYFWDHGMHPNLQQWFEDNGYRVNGKFALCDAFIEILSGTTQSGNSMKAPLEAIRTYGVIPARLIPLEDGMTWQQYMNRGRITEAHFKLGEEFLRRIVFNYEQVPLARFSEALADDLLNVALHAWPEPVNGVYPRTDDQINHIVEALNDEIDVFDNYEPFVKELAKDYKFFDWGYSLSITAQNPFPDEQIALFDTLQKYGLLAFFAAAWAKLVGWSAPQPQASPEPAQTSTQPSVPPQPAPVQPEAQPGSKYDWTTPEAARHSLRVICDEEGLTPEQKNLMSQVVHCESGYLTGAKHPNLVGGKVVSTDWGICQWNDYYHAKEITPEEAVQNPEKAVRLMCKYVKAGRINAWVCYSSGLYKTYTA